MRVGEWAERETQIERERESGRLANSLFPRRKQIQDRDFLRAISFVLFRASFGLN